MFEVEDTDTGRGDGRELSPQAIGLGGTCLLVLPCPVFLSYYTLMVNSEVSNLVIIIAACIYVYMLGVTLLGIFRCVLSRRCIFLPSCADHMRASFTSAWEFQNGSTDSMQVLMFLITLAICQQGSFLGVITSSECSGGEEETCLYSSVVDETLRDFASSAQDQCRVGVATDGYYVPWSSLCPCLQDPRLDGEESASWEVGEESASWAGAPSNATSSEPDLVCIADVLKSANNPPSDLLLGAWVALWLEVLVFSVTFAILFTTTAQAQKKAADQSGGAQVATLRGTLVGGTGLRSGHSGIPHAQRHTNYSQRYVVLSVSNPAVHKLSHRAQQIKTPESEDDPNPTWNHEFTGLALYADSNKLDIQVYDQIEGEPVLIGTAITADSGGSTDGIFMDLDEGKLTSPEYKMNGDIDKMVSIQLYHKKTEDQPNRPAGTLQLILNMYPENTMLLSTITSVIEQSLKYEAVIFAMVLLSMLDLALWSPAAALSPTMLAGLHIIELFIVLEMCFELVIEIEAARRRGETQLWRKPVFIFGVYNLAANMVWLVLDKTQGNLWVQKFVAVGRVTRLARGIERFRILPDVDVIEDALGAASQLFAMVLVLMFMLTFMFAIIGVSSFGGALQFECLLDGVQECDQAQNEVASRLGVECPLRCPMTLACAVDGYTWPWEEAMGLFEAPDKRCAPVREPIPVGYDSFGIRDFDNVWRATVTILVQATGDGGMHTIPLALSNAGARFTGRGWLVSFIISVLLNLVCLNLFLSVVCSAYSRSAAKATMARAEEKAAKEATIKESIATETAEERKTRIAIEEEVREKGKPVAQRSEEKDWVADGSAWMPPPIRMTLKNIVLSDLFETVASLIILANTVTMLMAHDGMSEQMESILQGFEMFFLFCYVVESIMIFVAQGSQLFFESSENRFDLFVILTSIMGTVAEFQPELVAKLFGGVDLGSVQSFRAVRLLRALQLVRLVGGQGALITIMGCIFKAWRPIVLHLVFCSFFMAVFAITGMHLFGGALRECEQSQCTLDDYERALPENFESFGVGMLTVFELTVGLDWSRSMYWYTEHASQSIGYPQWMVQVFFLIMVIWMNCILFSMFSAILIHNFGHPEDNRFNMQKRIYGRQERRTARMLKRLREALDLRSAAHEEEKLAEHISRADMASLLQHHHKNNDDDDIKNRSLYCFSLNSIVRDWCAQKLEQPSYRRRVMQMIVFSCIALAVEGRGEQGMGAVAASVTFVKDFVGFSYFSVINVLVFLFFVEEAILKIITHGFILTSGPTKPYLQKRMDQLDFFIIVVCFLSFLPFDTFAGPWVRALRVTAVARLIGPLLDKTDDPQISLVLMSFGRSIQDIMFAMLPVVVIGLMFAIVGVAWFTGTLSYCAALQDPLAPLPSVDAETCAAYHELALNTSAGAISDSAPGSWSATDSESESGSWVDDIVRAPLGFSWETPVLTFDDSITGMASLLVAAIDGSHEFMLKMAASSTSSYSYWVVFHLVFTCFFVNLFLCVPVASFAANSGRSLMTLGELQRSASALMIQNFEPGKVVGANVEELRPRRDSKCLCCQKAPSWWFSLRQLGFNIGINDRLEYIFQFITLANAFVLATDTYPINQFELPHRELVTILNMLFLVIGAAEVTLKLFGFGPADIFADKWLATDLLLVYLAIIMAFAGGRSGIEVLRCIRVARIYGVAVRLPGIVALIDILMASIKASLAVIVLVALTVYIYSIMGMFMFGGLPTNDKLRALGFTEESPGSGFDTLRETDEFFATVCPSCSTISPYTNFNNFVASSQSLIQMTFGQGIRGFIEDLQFLGSGWMGTYAYFASFYIVTVWVFMNILVATVLRNFDAANTSMSVGKEPIAPFDLDGFAHTWASLSIGVQRAKALERTGGLLLGHLRGVLEEEEEGLSEGIVSACFEDGADGQTGTLSVTVLSVSGLRDPKSTPYCAVTLHNRNVEGRDAQCTRTGANKNGTASFQPRQPPHDHLLGGLVDGLGGVAKGIGGVATGGITGGLGNVAGGLESLGGGLLGAIGNTLPFSSAIKQDNHFQFHTTTYTTHLTFQLHEAFQFEDTLLGAYSIPMNSAAGLSLLRMSSAASKEVQLELLINDVGKVEAALDGEADRWKLYNTDITAVGDVASDGEEGADSDSGDDEIVDREGSDDATDDDDEGVAVSGKKKAKKTAKQKGKSKRNLKNLEQEQTYDLEAALAEAAPTADAIREATKDAAVHSEKLEQAQKEAAARPNDAPIPRLSKKPKLEFPPRGEYPSDDEDEQDDEDANIPNPYEGWQPTGIKLKVTIEFLPLVNNVPKTQWLGDHAIAYPSMQATCGTEGWLELSEAGNPFKRRYCFLQAFPEPCFKFYRDCKSVAELEQRSKRTKLRVQKILGQNIMSLNEGHDSKTYARRNQFHHNFQMEAEQVVDGGGLVEQRVGFLTGEIVAAENLTDSQAETCTLCKRLYFEDLDDIHDYDDDEEDDGDDEEDDDDDENAEDAEEENRIGASGIPPELIVAQSFTVEDRPDQTNIRPTRYMAASRTTIRLSPDPRATKVGTVAKGTVVTVVAHKIFDGVKFLRTSDGWIAGNSEHRNNVLMIAEDSQAHYFRILKEVTIGKELSIAENIDAEPVGTLPRGCVVEVISSKKHLYRPGTTAADAREERVARSDECKSLSLHELRERAQQMEIDDDDIAEALDDENPKAELIELILDAGDVKGDEVAVIRHKVKCDLRGVLYGGPSGNCDGWISESDINGNITTDTYCVVETVPDIPDNTPNTLRVARRATQKARSPVIVNDTNPVWQTKFAFNVYNSCYTIRVSVREEGTDEEVGSATLMLGMEAGKRSTDGIPGPMLQTPSAKNVELSMADLTEHRFPISSSKANQGTVAIRLGYEQLVSHDDIFESYQAALADDKSATLVSCMMVPDTRLVRFRFQAPNPTIQRAWLAAMKWVAKGCPRDAKPRDVKLPINLLATSDSKRAERDLSLVDLPFSRVGQLLHGLYLRRVMGRRKPTLRHVAYTVFQLETHCFGPDNQDTARKRGIRGDADKEGVYLSDLRGLRFNATLERLIMTYYGKRRCLSYRDQVEEYEVEARSIASQIIRTMVSRWVFKTCARLGKTVDGQPWPYHPCWRNNPELYAIAADAACAQRMYTLRKLWSEVQRQSKPESGLEENDQVSEALASDNDPIPGTGADPSLVESLPVENGDVPVDDLVHETPETRRERIGAAFARIRERHDLTDGPEDELEARQLFDVLPLLNGVVLTPDDFKLIVNALGWSMDTIVSVDELSRAFETLEVPAVDLLLHDDDENPDLDNFDNFGLDPQEALRALVNKL
eukprot:COSAG02_NODE_608_length_19607_cov_201.543059_3_plen_3306_part_00